MNECNIISISGGRTSGFMAIKLLKWMPDAMMIFANTGKENEETLVFVNKINEYLGGGIVWIEYDPETWFKIVSFETASRNGEPFEALIKKRKYLPNRVARFCTQDLKIRPMKKYCQQVLGWDHWTNHVGIRYDEPNRWGKSKSVERNEVFDVNHPLVEWRITKPHILHFWNWDMPFNLGLDELDGNCDLCFLKGKAKKQRIARRNPERYEWWISMEKLTGSTFVNGITYEQLRKNVIAAPEIQFDDSIECFCNID